MNAILFTSPRDFTSYNNIDIALMMEAVRTFETPIYFNETTTWRYIPEGCLSSSYTAP
jgi:hypothetical protein